jgi:hypothetical protein
MGYDVYHNVVAGYIVGRADVYYQVDTPGCQHPQAQGANFCSKCGKPANKTRTCSRLEDAKLEEFEVAKIGGESPFDFAVGWAGDAKYSDDSDLVSLTMEDVQKLIGLRDKLRTALQAAGITVDESTFGVHSVLRHSY